MTFKWKQVLARFYKSRIRLPFCFGLMKQLWLNVMKQNFRQPVNRVIFSRSVLLTHRKYVKTEKLNMENDRNVFV